MPTYLFYPSRRDGVSLTFIAEAAQDDVGALDLASEIAAAHDCVAVFVWEPSAIGGKDRFVGEVERRATAHTRRCPLREPPSRPSVTGPSNEVARG
jgi:hypothetical protein